MSTSTDRDELPIDFGGPEDWPFEPFPREAIERPVIERFEAVARRHGDRPAVQDLERTLTYGELADRVGRLAGAIQAAAGARDGPVVLLLPNDAGFPTALLAAFAAGRGVVPLDAEHPLERNRLIAENAAPAALVSTSAILAEAQGLFQAGLATVDIGALAATPPISGAARSSGPEDLACIIYTSGSTGTPKGVFHDQRGLLHDIMQSVNALHMSCKDRVAMFYSAAVVAGLRVTLGALLAGAELHMLPPRELGSEGLVREIRRRGITMFRSSATLFGHVVDALGPGERMESLRMTVLGGDRVDWAHFDAFRRITKPNARFACHLGATECSLHTQWFVDETFRGDGLRLPVGRPVPERSARLIGEDGRPVPDGEVGEFVVSSRFIAQGYWRNPELTARAFGTDPDDPLARVYRTGDLGRRRPDGLYEFMGRRDHQVSIRGSRIEVGEVEAALQACTGVKSGAVLVRRAGNGHPRGLAAYVQLQRGVKGLAPRHLTAMLEQRLPAYMVPAEVFILDELPWLPNFKIDRLALERMDMARVSAPAPMSDPLLARVAGAFEEVLQVKGATGEDSLLSLGGDSLQAVDVVLELERRLGLTVPLETFQQSQSLRELTDWIAQRQGAA